MGRSQGRTEKAINTSSAPRGGREETSHQDREAETRALGQVLRRLRREKGLTLQQVASASGLSASFISMLEAGQSNPSVASLRQLATALGTSLFSLLAEVNKSQVVVRRDQRKTLKVPPYNVVFQLLSPTVQGAMEPALTTLPPGTAAAEYPMSHNCEEFTYVMSGRVELLLGHERYVLEAGDSVYFQAVIPHQYRNVGEEDAVILTVMSPPTF